MSRQGQLEVIVRRADGSIKAQARRERSADAGVQVWQALIDELLPEMDETALVEVNASPAIHEV